MSMFRDSVASMLADCGPDDTFDLLLAVKDVVGEEAFAREVALLLQREPVQVVVHVDGGIATPALVPQGVTVRVLDSDNHNAEEPLSDSVYEGPYGSPEEVAAIEAEGARLLARHEEYMAGQANS